MLDKPRICNLHLPVLANETEFSARQVILYTFEMNAISDVETGAHFRSLSSWCSDTAKLPWCIGDHLENWL